MELKWNLKLTPPSSWKSCQLLPGQWLGWLEDGRLRGTLEQEHIACDKHIPIIYDDTDIHYSVVVTNSLVRQGHKVWFYAVFHKVVSGLPSTVAEVIHIFQDTCLVIGFSVRCSTENVKSRAPKMNVWRLTIGKVLLRDTEILNKLVDLALTTALWNQHLQLTSITITDSCVCECV